MWRRFSFVLVVLSLTACAAVTSRSRPSFAIAGRDVLTAAEIVASNVGDAYEAVSHLRPEFLRRRPAAIVPQVGNIDVMVYVDELLFGNAESLRMVPLDRIRSIRYIDRTESDLRWPGNHPAGVILVKTQK